MTQITIVFDEKFDLEEGELKLNTADLEAGYGSTREAWEFSPENDAVQIDNSGDVTVVTILDSSNNFNPNNDFYVGEYWQFQYWVNHELIKATKHFPHKYLYNHHTSGQPINIVNVEKLFFYLNSDSVNGIDGPTYYEDEPVDGYPSYSYLGFNFQVEDATQLPEYLSHNDYDLNDMYIKIYINGNDYEYITKIGDLEEGLYGSDYSIDLNDVQEGLIYNDIGYIEIEFISPGVVSTKAYCSHDH